jgi:predicted transposase YdaD
LKEAYKMKMVSLRDYVREIDLEGAREEGKLEGEREGKLKGEREGKLQGKLEGEREGKLKGKREGLFEVARSMLADGFSAETIGKYTGLSERDILSLG